MDKDRAEAIKQKGGLPYLPSIAVGESHLELQPVIPINNEYNGNVRKQFVVTNPQSKTPSERLAWTVNPNSPLYRDLLGILPSAPCHIVVVRTGEGRSDTRYSIKKA